MHITKIIAALSCCYALAAPTLADNFAEKVANAKTYDLSHLWDEESPIASVNPGYEMNLGATHSAGSEEGGTRGNFGDEGQLSFTSENQSWSGQHGAPSIDAIGHIGRDGKLYGDIDAAQATIDKRGIGRSGIGAELDIAHFPIDILTSKAVLIDVARFINGDDSPLPAGFEITSQHLKDTLKAQKSKVAKGDSILIRTGWGQYFKGAPARYAGESSPGVGLEGAAYLVELGAKLVGNDTLTFEKRPPIATPPLVEKFQVFPVHMYLIADHGIFIVENYYLEELANDKVYEFALITPPLKIRGGTASALRAFALVK